MSHDYVSETIFFFKFAASTKINIEENKKKEKKRRKGIFLRG